MVADTTKKVITAAAKAGKPEDNTVTLSTGVVLRGKLVPPAMLIKIMAEFPRPRPPIWKDPIMGREMENPDDPEFLDQITSWKMEYSDATLNVMILMGTELVSTPKGFPGPQSEKWLQEYRVLGLKMEADNESWRYLNWIKFKAAPSAEDLNLIKEVVGKLSGVPEQSVAAAESFPAGDKNAG